MKAGIYLGKENIKVCDEHVPEVGDNDVLIKNIYSSICGTDVAVFKHGPGTGHKIGVGKEFGHETISRVVKVGKNVTDLKVGDRVYPYPLLVTGDTSRAGTIGGFSEYILAKNAELNKTLYAVPENITDKTACLIEPFTVGCRAARRSCPKVGEKAIVFGCGTIGLAAAMTLKYFGLEKVMISDISDFRLNIAKKLGFETCHSIKENLTEVAKDYFGVARTLDKETYDVDIFIDAAGVTSILGDFMSEGKIGSRFVSVAVNNAKRELDLLRLTYAQKSIIGSGGYFPEDVEDVMKMMASEKWDIESIITDVYPLDKLSEAIEKASHVDESLNVVIEFE